MQSRRQATDDVAFKIPDRMGIFAYVMFRILRSALMTQEEIERWAIAYIEAEQIGKIGTDHPLWWALEQFMGVGDYEPTADERWTAILEILHRNPPQSVIGNLVPVHWKILFMDMVRNSSSELSLMPAAIQRSVTCSAECGKAAHQTFGAAWRKRAEYLGMHDHNSVTESRLFVCRWMGNFLARPIV